MEFFATILRVKASVAGSMFRGAIFLHGSQLRAFRGQLATEENSFLQTVQMLSTDHAWHALGVDFLFRPIRTGVLHGRSVRQGRLWLTMARRTEIGGALRAHLESFQHSLINSIVPIMK